MVSLYKIVNHNEKNIVKDKPFKKNTRFNLIGVFFIVICLSTSFMLFQKFFSDNKNSILINPNDFTEYSEGFKEDWMDIFLKGEKIGYSMNRFYVVKEGYSIEEKVFLRMNLMNNVREISTIIMAKLDKNFQLLSFNLNMLSGIIKYKLEGYFDGKNIIIKGRGDNSSYKIPVDSPPILITSLSHLLRGQELIKGRSFQIQYFDPATLSNNTMTINVMGEDSIRFKKEIVKTVRLEMETLGHNFSMWMDKNGDILKEEGIMGLSMMRTTAEDAPLNIDKSGGTDFYDLSAIPVDYNFRDPRYIDYLKLEIPGDIDLPQGARGGRQRLNGNILEIRQEEFPIKADYLLPFNKTTSFNKYLSPEPFIESDHPDIIKKVDMILKGENDPIKAAQKILLWVYERLEKKPVISIPDALTVLNIMEGDCNEHAVLLTALLRSAGIPARPVAGITFNNGKFYYHAWVEAYLGKWISMDGVFNQMPVDATHVKLSQGEISNQIEIIRLFGKLKIKVLDFNDKNNKNK